MAIYFRLFDSSLLDITPEHYALLQANGKAAFLRLWVPTAPPVPSSAQRVAEAAPIIDATNATQAWALVQKTPAELDVDAQTTELAQLKTLIAALTSDIQAGITAAPTTAAQAFVEIQDLKRRALRTDRAIRWLLKQQ
jgi:hypothetical protein